ncbi:hypothetical protein VP01_2335g3 [Puccinia sorghi]|uniref:Uncharacterized protein n=1 Tax=Puccinia sorghi TaxID=27349 RepID=A0A0L6V7I6_9BASI|nr:hypothetical protein VP01_2335g3 [Puccinia sorghi]
MACAKYCEIYLQADTGLGVCLNKLETPYLYHQQWILPIKRSLQQGNSTKSKKPMIKSTYRFLHSGLNIVWDPLDEASIIAIIEFTPFNKLTASEKDDLNFLSTFLHNSKRFISPVSSCSRVWGGLMWAIAVWA